MPQDRSRSSIRSASSVGGGRERRQKVDRALDHRPWMGLGDAAETWLCEAFVPLHYPPGHAQVDFGEAVVEVGTAAISFSSARAPTTCAPIACKRARNAASEV